MSRENRIVTKIENGRMKMGRKDWDWFVDEADKAIGLEFHDVEPGKGPVTMSLDAWLFLLSVIKAALEYSAYVGGEGCQECCDEECEGHGGCDFCFGTAGACNDGDLVRCST